MKKPALEAWTSVALSGLPKKTGRYIVTIKFETEGYTFRQVTITSFDRKSMRWGCEIPWWVTVVAYILMPPKYMGD